MENGRIDEAGIICTGWIGQTDRTVTLYLDDLYFDGEPDYGVDFAKEQEEV